MLGVLLGYDGQVADLESVIAREILQGAFVVLGDLVGDQSRHGGRVCSGSRFQNTASRGGG